MKYELSLVASLLSLHEVLHSPGLHGFTWLAKRSWHHFAYLVAYIYTRPINVGMFWNLDVEV
jgi:hypothetical protein